MIHYDTGDADPSIPIEWLNRSGAVLDLSTGYTFRVRFRHVLTRVVAVDKTTGITGAATSPNVIITPATDWFANCDGIYELILQATSTAGSRPRTFRKGNLPLVSITPV